MFRMWGKIMKDNHLVKDMVACCGDYSISRTQMVFNCLDEICYKFDLEKPMWLDATVQDFKYHDKARFTQDNFIETVDFDYLETVNRAFGAVACVKLFHCTSMHH